MASAKPIATLRKILRSIGAQLQNEKEPEPRHHAQPQTEIARPGHLRRTHADQTATDHSEQGNSPKNRSRFRARGDLRFSDKFPDGCRQETTGSRSLKMMSG